MHRSNLLIVALLSLSLIALELVWTRIFSAEFFYTFAFLVLSLAVLGLGIGALLLRLLPGLNRQIHLGPLLAASGAVMVAAPPLVFRLGLDFSTLATSFKMIMIFGCTVILLGLPFLLGGIALAMIFKQHHGEMPRLYKADLLGAAVGVGVVLWLMHSVGTPIAAMLCALPMLAASLIASRGIMRLIPAVLVAGILLLCPWANSLLQAPREERAPVIYTHWDAMAKVKVYDFAGQYRGINIDNVANSPVYAFDGNFADPELKESEWGIDVSFLIGLFENCRFLSLGAGGGSDVLQALVEGATEVHAVEVNPHINRMMADGDPDGYRLPVQQDIAVHGPEGEDAELPPPPVIHGEDGHIITLAEFSGQIYNDPRVKVISEDARTYIRRHEGDIDLIYSLSSNTWAALGSGSFAFAENYIFTTEAFEDYWHALSPDGFLSMEHQVYMPRLVASAMDALSNLGVEDPAAHLAIYDLGKMRRKLMLLSKRALTDELRNLAYGELTPERAEHIRLLYPAAAGDEDNLINRIVIEGWPVVAATAAIDVSPSTDNRPFVAQTGLWRNFDIKGLDKLSTFAEFRGFPLSKIIIVVILIVVGLMVLPLTLLPYLCSVDKLRLAPWLYFFTIGMAFMIVEIMLIQMYALFIGASIYSISTVLLTLLLASGLGSGQCKRLSNKVIFSSIVAQVLLHAFVFGQLTGILTNLDQIGRVIVTALLVFPLGFFMGMPFPKGALKVGPLVDWGFAVNGAASVLGATAIMLVAFASGFTAALTVGAILYVLAFLMLRFDRAW